MRDLIRRLVVVSLVLSLLPVTGARGDEPPLAELALDVFKGRVQLAVERLKAAEDALAESVKAIAAGQAALTKLAERRAASTAPAAPTPDDGDDLAAAKRAMEHADQVVKHRKLLDRIGADTADALGTQVKALAAGIDRCGAVESRLVELRPLIAEVDRRRQAGTLEAKAATALLDGSTSKTLDARKAALESKRTAWGNRRAARADEVERLAAGRDARARSLAEAERALAGASERHQLAAERHLQAQAEDARDIGVLRALLAGAIGRRARLQQEYDGPRAALAKDGVSARTLAAARAFLDKKVTAPRAEDIDKAVTETKRAGLKAAQRAMALAVENKAYQLKRSKALDDVKAALEARLPLVDQASAAIDRLLRGTVRIQGLADVFTRRKLAVDADADAGALDKAVATLLADRRELARERKALADALAEIEKKRASVARALREQASLQVMAERELKREESAAKAAQAAAAETDVKALAARFVADVTQAATHRAALVRVRKETAAASQAVAAAEAALAAMEDPIVRRVAGVQTELHQLVVEHFSQAGTTAGEAAARAGTVVPERRRARFLAQLQRVIHGHGPPAEAPAAAPAQPAPKPADRPADPGAETRAPDAPALASPASPAADEVEPTPALTVSRSRYQRQLGVLSSWVAAGELRHAAEGTLLKALGTLETAVKQEVELLTRLLELAMKQHERARVLEQRVGEKALDALPAGAELAARGGGVLQLESALARASDRLPEFVRIRKYVEGVQTQRATLALLLKQRIEIASLKLEALRERAREAAEAAKPPPSSDVEKQRVTHAVQQRIRDEDGRWEAVLRQFDSADADAVTSQLETYYRKLGQLEALDGRLQRQIQITQRIARLIERDAKPAGELVPLLRTAAADLAAQTEAQRIGWMAPLLPESARKALLARHAAAGGAAVRPRPAVPAARRQAYVAQAVGSVERAYARALGVAAALGALEHDVSRLGLAAEAGSAADQIGELQAERTQLEPELRRLNGRDAEALKSLDPSERPRTVGAIQRYLAGDIRSTRDRRFRLLMWAALWSILSLIAIPLIAWLSIRLANRAGQRIVASVTEDEAETGAARQEREMRAKTLVDVFKTFWTMVVVIVAGIYMLKQLRVDITPLIASAGVLGLAVAFGAQSLVRDYVSGFFILLENQYTVGDVVDIGGVGGTVERLSLRLTVLRDVEGTVHYLPNGTISNVSNKTKTWSRVILDLGIAYDEDPERAFAVLREVGAALQADPDYGPLMLEPLQIPGVQLFGDSSVTIRAMFKVVAGKQFAMARVARQRVKAAFDAAKIEIPFPQRVVHHIHAGSPPGAAADGGDAARRAARAIDDDGPPPRAAGAAARVEPLEAVDPGPEEADRDEIKDAAVAELEAEKASGDPDAGVDPSPPFETSAADASREGRPGGRRRRRRGGRGRR